MLVNHQQSQWSDPGPPTAAAPGAGDSTIPKNHTKSCRNHTKLILLRTWIPNSICIWYIYIYIWLYIFPSVFGGFLIFWISSFYKYCRCFRQFPWNKLEKWCRMVVSNHVFDHWELISRPLSFFLIFVACILDGYLADFGSIWKLIRGQVGTKFGPKGWSKGCEKTSLKNPWKYVTRGCVRKGWSPPWGRTVFPVPPRLGSSMYM